MDTTGVETNRRDNCQFVRDTMTVTLDMIMKEQKVKEAEDYVKFRVSQLLQDKLKISVSDGAISLTKVLGMLRVGGVGREGEGAHAHKRESPSRQSTWPCSCVHSMRAGECW